MDLSGRAGDVGLALLTAAAVALSGYALLREPGPGPERAFVVPTPAPTTAPPAAVVVRTAAPVAGTMPTLLLRSPGTPSGHVLRAGIELDWQLAETLMTSPTIPDAVSGQRLVLLQAGADDQDDLVEALQRVRAAAPDVRVVVVAPLTGDAQPSQALVEAAQTARAELVVPAALGWLDDVDDAFQPNGSLTVEAAQRVGERMAEALAS